MPDKFTRTFAERLDKRGPFRVSEAQSGDILTAGTAYVCPGRQCMEVVASGQELRVRTTPPAPGDRYVPSADRLLRSAAEAHGSRSVAVILTGMGDDGLVGARAIHEAGGLVIVESPETAVVNGMPGAVHRAGLAHHVLPLPMIADFLLGLGTPDAPSPGNDAPWLTRRPRTQAFARRRDFTRRLSVRLADT
jgi:two-component system chemotaxis response regulator CheB